MARSPSSWASHNPWDPSRFNGHPAFHGKTRRNPHSAVGYYSLMLDELSSCCTTEPLVKDRHAGFQRKGVSPMAGASQAIILDINETRIHVVRRGQGPPLFALHGGPGLDHTTLMPGMGPVEKQHELIYIDLRCHGLSGRPETPPLSMQQMVRDIEGIREALGFNTISILGHSMGGKLALLYALKHPYRVRSLVIAGSSPAPPRFARSFMGAPGRLGTKFRLLLWVILFGWRQALSSSWSIEESMRLYWRWCWPFYTRRTEPSTALKPLLLHALIPPLTGARELLVEMDTLDLSRVIHQIQVRTLAICGVDDPLYATDQRLFERVPHAAVILLPCSGHFLNLDNPTEYAQSLLTFLSRDHEHCGQSTD